MVQRINPNLEAGLRTIVGISTIPALLFAAEAVRECALPLAAE
jgi:hypothetical protein